MRGRVVVALAAALVVVGGAVMIGAGHVVPVLASARSESNGGPDGLGAFGGLRLIAGNPVLVRLGERVRVPVDVICTTARGTCSADLSMDVSDGTTSSRATVPDANGVVRFDLAVPMARAVAAGGRSIAFRLTARDELGRQAALPASASSPLRAYVTDELQPLDVPAVPFGSAVSGETLLFLPWGTGPLRAGFAPGLESLPAGPASFDVDASGRIFLLDRLQARLAVFGAGLVRETALEAPDPTDVAVTASGECLVLSGRFGGPATIRTIDPAGVLGPSVVVGEGLPSQLRAVGDRAYAKLLPLEAWVEVRGRMATPTTGLPLADGRELLSVVRPEDDSVRLGLVSGGRVVDAIELRFAARVGELALAATMDDGAYLAVVRVARDGPNAADQYLVVRVSADRAVSTFPVASRAFAGPSPMSRFRLGADGNLYQLTSSPDGVRVQRFQIGGAS